MPELPDVTVYIEALEERILDHTLSSIRISSPFVVRSVDPEPSAFHGRVVRGIRRFGKRIVLDFDDDLHIVVHLMIAGRLKWSPPAKAAGKILLATFVFENGSLLFTEAGSKKRASLHFVRGEDALELHRRGGMEVLASSFVEFSERLLSENHTLKRSLTDPRLFSGIGNAYSDEILHRAKLSPVKLTSRLTREEVERLHRAVIDTMAEWIERLRAERRGKFPENVTAFRPEMAVHGKFGKPCPVCGTPVQHIVYAENETNYCPECQTEGKLLADRALSRLLGSDWPKSLDELEERTERRKLPEE